MLFILSQSCCTALILSYIIFVCVNVSKEKEYEAFKDSDRSGKVWAALPGSVIGTLLYFMKVEQNTPNFDFLSSLKASKYRDA